MKEEPINWKEYIKKNSDNLKLGGIVLGIVGICGVIAKVINKDESIEPDSIDDVSDEE